MKNLITKLFSRYRHDKNGTVAVEFGMISIAFIALLFTIIEGGRLFLAWNGFQYSIESAARQAIVDTDITEAEVETLVDDQLSTFLMDSSNATIAVTFPQSSGVDFVEINGAYNYNVLIPFAPSEWSSLSLAAKSRLARQ